MSYTLLPGSPPPPGKSKPHPPAHFISHHLPLLLTITFLLLITLTVILLLPITGLGLLATGAGGGTTCPCLHQSLLHDQSQGISEQTPILTSFRENPLDDTSSSSSSPFLFSTSTTKNNPQPGKEWEAKLIPPTSGGGLFASHLDDVTEGVVERVDPNRTHSGVLDRSYGIAMFHQLHCMGALRGRVFGFSTGHSHSRSRSESGDEGENGDTEGGTLSEKERDHLTHCFNYILQSILCSASDTIERPKHITPHGRPMWHIDGIGDVHRCQDARMLWRVSEGSLRKPVDMRGWKGEEGVGVREFFG